MCDDRTMQEVQVEAIPIERLARLLDDHRGAQFRASADRARALLAGRTVWNINATATGGGVAEMLQSLLAYGRGAGVDTRWLALDAAPALLPLHKRLHNRLHGTAGDGGPVDEGQRTAYEATLEPNLAQLRTVVQAGDIVLLHDPQTAGLAGELRQRREDGLALPRRQGRPQRAHRRGWNFLRPYVEQAHDVIFSRRVYAPPWVDADHLWVIPPSLDPFSPKNCGLTEADVAAALALQGWWTWVMPPTTSTFTRRDGSTGTVRRHAGLLPVAPRSARRQGRPAGQPLGPPQGHGRGTPRLRPHDLSAARRRPSDAGRSGHVRGGDDPEGAEVLEECRTIWRAQPVEDAAPSAPLQPAHG